MSRARPTTRRSSGSSRSAARSRRLPETAAGDVDARRRAATASSRRRWRRVALEEEFYRVEGDTLNGGVVVSRFSDRVDFHDQLNNRVVNLVPMPDLAKVVPAGATTTTQTVGIYPESLRDRLRDALALAGVQRMVPLAR